MLKPSSESPMITLPDAHSCSIISTILAQPEFILYTPTAACTRLCARALSQASKMNLTILPQTTLATLQYGTNNQPLACILTLHYVV